jgi:hypothetical protein
VSIIRHAETFSLWTLSAIQLQNKCTLVQALRLCTGRTAHWECRVSTLIFLRQTMSVGNTVLQLFWCNYSWCSYR